MKRIFTILMMAVLMAGGCTFASTNRNNDSSADSSSAAAEALKAAPHAVSLPAVKVKLPKPMLPGPVDPVWAEGESPLLGVAWLGHFASIDEMRRSVFYPILLSAYPPLDGIQELAVDTGDGDLWFFLPLEDNMSIALNEYDMDMFMGKRDENEGKVLMRTEYARPFVVRMCA